MCDNRDFVIYSQVYVNVEAVMKAEPAKEVRSSVTPSFFLVIIPNVPFVLPLICV